MFAALAPYRLMIEIGAVLALLIGLYTYAHHEGYQSAKNADAAIQLVAVKNAIAQAQQIAAQDNEILMSNSVQADKTRTITKTIIQRIHDHAQTNPMPVNCNLDADRMRSISDAINNATDTGKFTAPLSVTQPTSVK